MGCGLGVFIGVEVDRGGGKRSGGTLEVDLETLLEIVLSYTYNPTNKHTHTHTHTCIRTFHGSIRV